MRALTLVLILTVQAFAFAQKGESKLKTEHDFGALTLKGQQKQPMEASIFAEKSKTVYEILSVRKHFKDRVSQELKEMR